MTDIGIGLSVPAWLALTLIAIGTLVAWWFYVSSRPTVSRRRRYMLTGLRSLALTLLLLTLFETWVAQSGIESEPREIIIALDRSSSMGRTDNGTSRFQRGVEAAAYLSKEIGPGRSRLLLFTDSVNEVTLDSLGKFDATGRGTDIDRLLASIATGTFGEEVGGVILVSDGLQTVTTSNRPGSGSIPFPVHTLPPGPSPGLPDLGITSIRTPRFGFPGVSQPVSVRIEGNLPAATDATVLLSDGRGFSERRSLRLRAGEGEYNASFLYRPTTSGRVRLQATVPEIEMESNRKNNSLSTSIDVQDVQRSVLLLAGAPGPDVAFVRRIIERMPDVDLTVKIGLGRNPVSIRSDELEGKDLLVLVNFPTGSTSETAIEVLESALERDPLSLLVIPGRQTSSEALTRLRVPFTGSTDWDRVTEAIAQPVPGGVRHALTGEVRDALEQTDWESLPPLSVPAERPEVAPDASILLQTGNGDLARPLLVTVERGGSRIVMFAGYDVWRWELVGEGLAEARGAESFPLLRSLVSSSVRWLESGRSPEKVSISPVRATWRLGEAVVFRGEFRDSRQDEERDFEFTGLVRKGETRHPIRFSPVGPGLAEGRVTGLEAGEWGYSGRVTSQGLKLGSDAGTFIIDSSDIEDRSRGIDHRHLRGLSAATGGIAAQVSELDNLVDSVLAHPSAQPRAVEVRSETLLRNSAWILATALLLFSIEWYLRRRWGLL